MKELNQINRKYVVAGLIINAILIIYMTKKNGIIIDYKTNSNLPVIKKGWKGNIVINGRFYNDNIQEKPPLWDVVKWKFSRDPQREEKKSDTFKLSSCHFDSIKKSGDKIIWLGHSSFIIIVEGVILITDPVFFDLSMVKREVPIPCDENCLNQIDYLLISHDHRDHLDKKSINIIAKNNQDIEMLLPLNASSVFNTKEFKNITKQEAGWYQEYKIKNNIRIIFLPARHWGRRGLFDFNKILWGSFLIIAGKTKIFFSGDTAYDNKMFKEIQSEFGTIDICILPIGAYSPTFIMKTSHTTPEEAIKIFNDLKGKLFVPMHYGTYDLSDEPLGEPIKRLEKYFESKEHRNKLKRLIVGEKFIFSN